MKKKFLILIAAFILTITSSFANKIDSNVPEAVVSEFSYVFYNAQNVKWEKIDDYYKVSFSQFGTTLFAFYSKDNELMGIANYILSEELPVSLESAIKKKYSDYWISDLFKYSINDKPGYFVALENADYKIMLKSDNAQNWYLYKTTIK